MSDTPFDPEAVIDALAPLLGLDLRPEFRPGIVTNLKVAAGMAALLFEAPIGDHAEPAAVFVPNQDLVPPVVA